METILGVDRLNLFMMSVILALFVSSPASAWGEERTLNILYTGAIAGELEPCGCSPKTEAGGLARLAGFILKEKDGLEPYILIDAGNSFGEDTAQGRLKAEALLNAFGVMGFDAVAFGGHETAFPKDFLSPLVERYKTPVVSSSVGYARSVLFERASVRLNISADEGGFVKDRFNVLVTGRPVVELKKLRGWDVIITSSGESLEEPLSGKGIIVSGQAKGKRLGILTLVFDDSGLKRFAHRWQTLSKDIADGAAVRAVLKGYDSKVALLLEEESKRAVGAGPYVGARACAECHKPFYDGWVSTRHAFAFQALERAGKSNDPECVSCHTIGFGAAGFLSAARTPGLTNVQCEACHGPGKDHALDFNAAMRPVLEQVCLRCHTKANSPDFDFPSYYEKIKH